MRISEQPDVLVRLSKCRDRRNSLRRILDEYTPQLIEFERLVPSIFDMGSAAGQANRSVLLTAIEEGDDAALKFLIQAYEPTYQAQRQLEQDSIRLKRKMASDLPSGVSR